jgi:hypothetical protein
VTKEELAESLAGLDEDILLADGFEDAYLGLVRRCGQPAFALYDRDACLRILVERDRMSPEEAEEYFAFNVEDAWGGPGTPGFVYRPE